MVAVSGCESKHYIKVIEKVKSQLDAGTITTYADTMQATTAAILEYDEL